MEKKFNLSEKMHKGFNNSLTVSKNVEKILLNEE